MWELGQRDTNSPLLADRHLLTEPFYGSGMEHMEHIFSPIKAVNKILFSFKHVHRMEGSDSLT